MKAFRLLLLIFGLMEIVAAIVGIHSIRFASAAGFHFFPFDSLWARVATGAMGLAFAIAAIRGGFNLWLGGTMFFLAVAVTLVLQGVIVAFGSEDAFTQVWAVASQIVAAAVVITVFIKWWLPKRKSAVSD